MEKPEFKRGQHIHLIKHVRLGNELSAYRTCTHSAYGAA